MLTEKQKEAVKLLAVDGIKVQDAATLLGMHRCTIWRWRQLKAFQHEWEKQCKVILRRHSRNSYIAWNAELTQLEKALNTASAKARGRNTKALNAAWNVYSRHLYRPLDLLIKTRKRKMANR